MDKLAVSPAECAQLLGVSRQRLYDLIHRSDFRRLSWAPVR